MKISKIIFCLLSTVLLGACRSSRPTTVCDVSNDSLNLSKEKFLSVRKDSISISTELMNRINDTIEFGDGGGCIYVSSDGSVIMSDVAKVKSSRLNTSANKAESQKLDLQYQSKDSITETHIATTMSESRPSDSSGKFCIKLIARCAVILMLIMLIAKINRKN
ncbi:MAG: hypothetical protein K2L11_07715 [Muribaculaceae bacterium]|nr:hypothetical protein [Muribaculaceae bacterium]